MGEHFQRNSECLGEGIDIFIVNDVRKGLVRMPTQSRKRDGVAVRVRRACFWYQDPATQGLSERVLKLPRRLSYTVSTPG